MGGSLVDNNLPTGANTTTYLYDLVGNLASVTEPNGVATTYSCNKLHRLADEMDRLPTPVLRFPPLPLW